jgi:eukaryotic-like serine/threonine-protein kinase
MRGRQPVSPDRWARVEALFARALELPTGERPALLAAECAGDPELLFQVNRLLAAHAELATGAGPAGVPGTGAPPASQAADVAGRAFLAELDAVRAEALMATAMLDEAGTRIGRYEVIRRIGRGGMGVVYLARDPRLEREVALKLLPAYLRGDGDANRRLLAEARAASALDHPGIATVFEVGETGDGRLFMAMAYCPGETLRRHLDGGPMTVERALDIAAQVADGLAAAHARGIVHRDVKPENIVCGDDGRVRILDFGIARAADTVLGRITGTPGTVAYMSPEQTTGDDVDPRSDIWSLGVMLYEMLAGERPFVAAGTDGIIHRIRHHPPSALAAVRPGLPAGVEAAVMGCLAREPDARTPSAAHLAATLRELHGRMTGAAAAGAGPALSLRRGGAYLAAAALVLALMSALDGWLLLPRGSLAAAAAILAAGVALVAAGSLRRQPFPGLRVAPAALLLALLVVAGGSGITAAAGAPRVTASRGSGTPLEGERPLLILAEVEADSSLAAVAAAAGEALGIDLQQSGMVRLPSGEQVAGTLRRMGLPETTPVTAGVARELAERMGAGAILLVEISRLGPQYVLSSRAVRPGTGEELFAVRTAAGEAKLLQGVEQLSRSVRRHLGEARDEVRRSRPLPEVTTPSLEALRHYAAAERLASSAPMAAVAAVNAALAADPDFAMAHRLAGTLAYNQLRFGVADQHFTRAWELRDRLTDRERLHTIAIYHGKVELEPQEAAAALELILQRYPDDFMALSQLGFLLHSWLDDHQGGHALVMRALELDPFSALSLGNAVYSSFSAGNLARADSVAALAEQNGVPAVALRWRTARSFAVGDHARRITLCDSLLAGRPRQPPTADDFEFCGSADVAAGRLNQGIARLEVAERSYREAGRHRNVVHAAQGMAAAQLMQGDRAAAAATIRRIVDGLDGEEVPEPDRFINRTNLQVQAALMGETALVERIRRSYPPYPRAGHWFGVAGDGLVSGALALHAGRPEEALSAVRGSWPTDRDPLGWRVWKGLIQGLAWEQLGRPDSAVASYRMAAEPHLLAIRSQTKNRLYLPVVLERLASAAAAAGDHATAAESWQQLEALWGEADPVMQPRVDGARRGLQQARARAP